MAIVSRKTNTWVNADGLAVFFGTDMGSATAGGAVNVYGPRQELTFDIDLTTLPTVASGNQQILSDTLVVPKGALIDEIEVLVTKETTGTNAVLNMGFVALDRTTLTSATSLLSALASINDGTDLGEFTRIQKGSTGAGTSVGTVTAASYLVCASATVADFTAGVVKVRVFYTVPLTTEQ